MGDQAVRRVQDRPGRAVVLLELDRGGLGEVALEVEDVADVGGAEAVDRLRFVTDDEEVPVLAGEQLQEPVLDAVGVLVLVDEDVAEVVGVALAEVGEELEQVDGADEQVVEVHRVGGVHPLLVELVDVGDRRLEERALLLAQGLGVAEPVLSAGDLALDRPRREALRVDVELVHAALDHPPRVGLVVDREAALVGEPVGVLAEDPRAGRVEGHHPHHPRRGAGQRPDALLHLPRRLVREGDREDLARPRHSGGQQVGDPVGQHPRLARPRARQDQHRTLAVLDGLRLRRIQPREQALDRGRAGADRRPGYGLIERVLGVLVHPS